MQSTTLYRLSSVALIAAGLFYIADTVADWLMPGNVFAFGIGVPLFGLFGMTAVYFLHKDAGGWIALLAYIFSSMGLTGLAGIAFFNNLLRPLLTPEVLGVLVAGPARFYFLGTGVAFLVGGILWMVAILKSKQLPRATGPLYALGCVPVALPPLFPTIATDLGGLAISAALLVWGVTVFGIKPTGAGSTSD